MLAEVDPDRFRLTGKDARVHPKVAVTLTMALHELMTNAADLGCEVVVAMRLDQASACVGSQHFDCAILDVNLGATRSYPIADALARLGIPFSLRDTEPQVCKESKAASPLVQKPYQSRYLQYALLDLLGCRERPRENSDVISRYA